MIDQTLDEVCEKLAIARLLTNLTKTQLETLSHQELLERLESIGKGLNCAHTKASELRSPEHMEKRAKSAQRIIDGRPNLRVV